MVVANCTLQEKIQAFRLAEEELHDAVEANLVPRIHQAETRLSLLHHTISRHPSTTAVELGMQMRFLLDRIAAQSTAGTDGTDYSELCELISSRLTPMTGLPAAPLISETLAGEQWAPDENPLQLLSIADHVGRSPDRISIIGTDYRYLHTSLGNSEFYNASRRRIVGKHLAEMIGASRFETRARHYLDACFSDGIQDYNHPLEIDGSQRIMNCRMSPVRDRHNVLVGALITMRDITESILSGRQEQGQPTRHGH